ncbi:hypothetical protein [Tsukamurella paurometabola]|uniref:hypothetical protein n=1 Tax=Tsukamurella paurometabola TaxID=2061 RepID=UPI0013DE7CF8|nr:hypothetical protein [Tsukamurella paurometabola]UEA85335.1 hypothetical protein LK411_11185 [Tsukamurella paurometabola]
MNPPHRAERAIPDRAVVEGALTATRTGAAADDVVAIATDRADGPVVAARPN